MNEYINYYDTSDEDLLHYGVLGMKWGIRRARKTLSSSKSTEGDRKVALDSLEKHRRKASEKVAKLEAKRPKLEDRVNTKVSKYQSKAAELSDRAARQQRKAYGLLATEESKKYRLNKANKLQSQADAINADIAKAKSKLAENDAKTALFKKGINEIEDLLVSNGRKLTDLYKDDVPEDSSNGLSLGPRRYQNPDGSLTELGKKEYEKRRAKK